jgi:hypothetical protein
MEKNSFKKLIGANIEQFGFHITVVNSDAIPRYAYTIGLTDSLGFELVFAGGTHFLKDDLFEIFNRIADGLKGAAKQDCTELMIASLGLFTLSIADTSWCNLLMLGVFDYYNVSIMKGLQIIPDSSHFTLDVPTMSQSFDVIANPIWRWLKQEWEYNVPKSSKVVTNLSALSGHTITEITRWEDDQWEMFAGAGPDVNQSDIRIVPLGTILGIDDSVFPATELNIGKGLWREEGQLAWNDWG